MRGGVGGQEIDASRILAIMAYQMMLANIFGCATIVIDQKKTKYLLQ